MEAYVTCLLTEGVRPMDMEARDFLRASAPILSTKASKSSFRGNHHVDTSVLADSAVSARTASTCLPFLAAWPSRNRRRALSRSRVEMGTVSSVPFFSRSRRSVASQFSLSLTMILLLRRSSRFADFCILFTLFLNCAICSRSAAVRCWCFKYSRSTAAAASRARCFDKSLETNSIVKAAMPSILRAPFLRFTRLTILLALHVAWTHAWSPSLLSNCCWIAFCFFSTKCSSETKWMVATAVNQ
mmetsp:Transcript_43815/g.103599  ORF Transcript_43815/g.103599 Transcript_43815/m.103599 type:complete len:243 (+) Transcript_43815:170-898(+)